MTRRTSPRNLSVAALAVLAMGCGAGGSPEPGVEGALETQVSETPGTRLSEAVQTRLSKAVEARLAQAIETRLSEVQRDREWAASVLDSAYAIRAARPLWTSPAGLSGLGRQLVETLGAAGNEGLEPEAYGVGAVREALHAFGEAAIELDRAERLAEVEVALSLGFVEYARDLVRGRFEPTEARQDWEIEPEPLPANPLRRVAEGESLAHVVQSLRPRLPYYDRLIRALASLRDVEATGGWPRVGPGTAPEIGERGERVVALRARLAASLDPEERRLAGLAPDSARDTYDEELFEALKRFQRRHGLEPDGVLGPATLRELDTPIETRIESVELNLDRLRWLPRDLGPRAIVVNVAGFEFELLEQNEPQLEMRVVVGREEWATKLFAAEMDHLVLNPYWNVPRSILAGEIAPAVRQDPGYLTRNGYQVLDADGSLVDPSDVDWSGGPRLASTGAADDAGPDWVRVRQVPGAGNALGRVKFMFPNPYNIYLHDTPADHLFGRAYRAFSHGCIRVEHPVHLAREIVGRYTDRSPDEVDAILKSGKTETITLDRPVAVHIAYFTAWVEEDDTLHFYRDVYDRDPVLHRMIAAAARPKPPLAGP